MMGVLGRLPAAVFMIVGLLIAAAVLQAGAVTPDQIAVLVGGLVAYLLGVVVVLLPFGAAIVGLIAVIEVLINRRDRAIEAAIGAVALVVIDGIWRLTPFGAWAVAHLAGKA